jgi:hypothetical protein
MKAALGKSSHMGYFDKPTEASADRTHVWRLNDGDTAWPK